MEIVVIEILYVHDNPWDIRSRSLLYILSEKNKNQQSTQQLIVSKMRLLNKLQWKL